MFRGRYFLESFWDPSHAHRNEKFRCRGIMLMLSTECGQSSRVRLSLPAAYAVVIPIRLIRPPHYRYTNDAV